MIDKIDLQGSAAITMANKIAKICAPLRTLGITHFQYLRRFPNGSRFILCDCPQVMSLFYEACFYPFAWYDNDKSISNYKTGFEFWPVKSLYNTPEQKVLDENMNKFFNINQSVTYVDKNEKFVEFYRFYSHDTSIYLINYRIFYHFIYFFKQEAQKLILKSQHESFAVPVKEKNKPIYDEKENFFMKETPVSKYYLQGKFNKIYLTPREKDCLHWCTQGKSCEEIAIILGISKKTVENNVHKIKEKLDCYKQS